MSDRILTAGQLGPTLRALRETHGWSQATLGRRLGLSQERVSAIERRPERITVEQLLAVLMALEAELTVQPRPETPPPGPW
jgi:HTH-type transcriptional regulator/antitoxin HipB